MEFNVTVGENGRIVIPVIFRKQLNIKPGDEITMTLSPENDLIVRTPKQSLHKLQQLLKKSEGSFVDELIKMRRREEV